MSQCSAINCTDEAETERVFEYVMTYNGLTLQTSGGLCKDHWQLLMGSSEKPKNTLPRCSACGKPCQTECAHCNLPFCESCYNQHEFIRFKQKQQESKEGPFHSRRCTDCNTPCDSHSLYIREGKIYCRACYRRRETAEYQERNPHYKFCIECGNPALSFACPICKGALCPTCLLAHERRAHPKQEPEDKPYKCFKCNKKLSEGEAMKDGLMQLCVGCYLEYIAKQRHFTWRDEPKASTDPRIWVCCMCKQEFSNFVTKNYAGSNQFCCDACYDKRQEQARAESARWEHTFTGFTYNARPDYGTFADDEMKRFWGMFAGEHSTAGASPKTEAPKQPVGSELPTNSIQAFRILGIQPTSDAEKIKKAYHKLALKYHPDKPTGDANKMKQINLANDLAMRYAGKK